MFEPTPLGTITNRNENPLTIPPNGTIVHAMGLLRTVIALGAALCVVVGIALSPFIFLHELESHHPHELESHHRSPEQASTRSVELPGHTHGDHCHPTSQVIINGARYSVTGHGGVLSVVSSVDFNVRLVDGTRALQNRISCSRRFRSPLSLTTSLLI